ncbi:unnamed protein product [Bursaphelenchus okinawaensis]|uniref:G protein-coupled receptor n=1 Tax=Bursaphelenchus okinawaensis TaxID=465554 RepID=A0A811LMQ5_9BILA|nr:unnamed protein product [Bursaphelenchus okinawaensis]CAG9124411.1 unnamed protein product [Bursaphelenchus okinawaensis]
MLLVSCFCDIWCWFSTFMIQLDCNIKDKVLLLHVNGNVKVFNYDTQALWISLYAVGVGTAVAILPANYYYRYRCIKEGPPRLLTMIFLYALALSMGFTYGLLCYFTMELSGNARPGFNYATLWWDAQNAPILLPGDIRSLVTKLCLGFTSIGFGTLYFIAMLLSRRTLHYFASNITLFSKGTVLIQRQLTSALMLQALVPIVTSVGPCAFLSWCAFFDMDAGVGGMLIYLFLACLPIFSPLATIFTIKPYRTAVVGVFITNETSTHYSERS